MKKLGIIIGIMLFFSAGYGQKNLEEIRIKTSAQCGECKELIEYTLAYERGVKEFELNLETKEAIIKYKPGKTTPGKLREAIANTGYDADTVPADQEAYRDLPDCCKKPEDREHDHTGHEH